MFNPEQTEQLLQFRARLEEAERAKKGSEPALSVKVSLPQPQSETPVVAMPPRVEGHSGVPTLGTTTIDGKTYKIVDLDADDSDAWESVNTPHKATVAHALRTPPQQLRLRQDGQPLKSAVMLHGFRGKR